MRKSDLCWTTLKIQWRNNVAQYQPSQNITQVHKYYMISMGEGGRPFNLKLKWSRMQAPSKVLTF